MPYDVFGAALPQRKANRFNAKDPRSIFGQKEIFNRRESGLNLWFNRGGAGDFERAQI
jgi:hypothetical protein